MSMLIQYLWKLVATHAIQPNSKAYVGNIA